MALSSCPKRACGGFDDDGTADQRAVRAHQDPIPFLAMELAARVTALCVVGAILALVLKKASPEQALLLVLCAAAAGLALLGDGLGELTDFLRELGERSGVSAELFIPLYKTVGIGLVVKVGGDLCRDAGGSALASVVETAGAVCALLTAMPMLRAVLEMLMELMG